MGRKAKISRVFKYILIFALFILFITPFYIMIVNSFKTTQHFIENPFALPTYFNFRNHVEAFQKMNFLNALKNSTIIMTLSVALIIISSSMTAYFLVRNKWRTTKAIYAIFVASMIVPFQAIMIPLVSIYGKLDLMNNKWTLIFMYMGFGQALAIFIFHGFIKGIPLEMEEAALIDGCNSMQSFFLIVFPLLKPVIVTISILDVLWIWNDYLLPSLILISPSERTLPLSTYRFFSSYSVDYSQLMAGIILTILPVLVAYIFAQKQIVEGVVKGAIK